MEQSPAALRIHLLGDFFVERADMPVPRTAWKRRGAASLVKLLALSYGRPLHRDQVLEILWPDLELPAALNALRKASHAARHALEPELMAWTHSSYLLFQDDMLSLLESVWVDVVHFERLASYALKVGDAASLERALSAYSGDLLPADRYEDWTKAKRDALTEGHVHLLLRAATVREREGDYEVAVARLQSVLEHDLTREDVHRGLMRLLVRTGRKREALAQYEQCRGALREEFDVAPEPRTVELYREIAGSCLSEGEYIHPQSRVDQPETERNLGAAHVDLVARAIVKVVTHSRTSTLGDQELARLERVAAVCQRNDDLEGLARATAEIGSLYFLQGRASEGVRRLEEVASHFSSREVSAGLAGLQTVLASLYWVSGRYREQLDAAQRAKRLARELGEGQIEADAAVWQGLGLVALGRTDDGLKALEEAVTPADDVGGTLE